MIPLSKGKFAIVDEDDFERLSVYKWCVSARGYAVRNIFPNKIQKTEHMHKVIFGRDNTQVDHINQDKLDNRKSNLRPCNHSQNGANSSLRKLNTTGYKGVVWDGSRNKYRAQITFNNKSMCIGRFETAIEAAKAYNRKAKEFWGEYAFLNQTTN